jgi:hypothetical protein
MDQRSTTVVAGSGGGTAGPPEVTLFAARLGRMSGEQIEGLAAALRAGHDTADGEVQWWRATLGVERSLRCARRGRAAGFAAHEASTAVLRAAEVAGIRSTSRDSVTLVARAASEVARAIVAAGDVVPCRAAAIPAWDAVLATADVVA